MTLPSSDWLDDEPKKAAAPRKQKRTRKSKDARTRKKLSVVSGSHIPYEAAKRFREGKVWGCDGNFVFYRPRRMIEGVMTQVANPTMVDRHARFIRQGHYEYIETQDDVQIFRVTDKSPFKRGFGSLDDMNESTLKRAIIMSAVKREWTLYCDCLEEMAARIQARAVTSDGQGAGQLQRNQWNEMLQYIEIQISMRGGPGPAECGRELQRVRLARNGGGEEKRILLI